MYNPLGTYAFPLRSSAGSSANLSTGKSIEISCLILRSFIPATLGGTNSHGTPTMESKTSASNRSDSGRLLIVQARNTPFEVPMYFMALPSWMPRKTPSSNRASNLLPQRSPFNGWYKTVSPNSGKSCFQVFPVERSYGVRPSAPLLYLDNKTEA